LFEERSGHDLLVAREAVWVEQCTTDDRDEDD
jgi:hypothetical protein